MLEAHNLTKIYSNDYNKKKTKSCGSKERGSGSGENDGKHVIFRNLNFEAGDGEFVSLIGMSGCGKSTLLRLLSGLEAPTEGDISFDGRKVDAPVSDGAFVFQDYALFPWRTVLRNVTFGLEISKKLTKQQIREKGMECLKLVHLEEYAEAYIHQLSGGMKQRVAIARALVMEPRILFMDEPFGALDSFTRMELQSLLLDIVRRWKLSVIFVTHDIDEAIILSDRVTIMNRNTGRIDHDIAIHFEGQRNRANGEFNILKRHIMEKFGLTTETDVAYII